MDVPSFGVLTSSGDDGVDGDGSRDAAGVADLLLVLGLSPSISDDSTLKSLSLTRLLIARLPFFTNFAFSSSSLAFCLEA